MKKQINIQLKIINTVFFLIMITVNALANILPINGITTGEVSDSYPDLFAPAPITFAIWGVIYFLLALFVLYQFGLFGGKSPNAESVVTRIGWLFVISSVVNAAWIFSWHYRIIPLTLLLMIMLLFSLIGINQKLKQQPLSKKEHFFVRVPFSIYFGWVTVATIANVTALLVSLGWNGFGIPESLWMMLVVLVGLVIGVVTILKNIDWTYGLVFLWAYTGILIKHLTVFNGQYIGVIITVAASLVVLLVTVIKVIRDK